MKLLSWNVNGIRAVLKKGFLEFLLNEAPDVLCLQEIKISAAAKDEQNLDFPGYLAYWNCAQRPGYSGTAILVREGVKPLKNLNGFGQDRFDGEGRTQIMEFSEFYLVNCYFPNANAELSRLDYKLAFNRDLQKHLKTLEKHKPIIITGDFNVAHQEIDLARPKDNLGSAGFTIEERAWFDSFLKDGFLDSFRALNGDKIQYSWWSYRAAARLRNVGWRIDYFCTSVKLKKSLKKAYILDKVVGSDHAPIGLEIAL
jgi:exodeoxyribonuclease-3